MSEAATALNTHPNSAAIMVQFLGAEYSVDNGPQTLRCKLMLA